MKRSELSALTCSLASALSVIGDTWSLLVLKEIMLGNRKFEGIQKQTGISSNSLASRLKALEGEGILRRRAYAATPVRFEYLVTGKGQALWPVLVAITQWGDRHARRGGAPLRFRHKTCGEMAEPRLTCGHCQEPLSARDVSPVQSPAMKRDRGQRAK